MNIRILVPVFLFVLLVGCEARVVLTPEQCRLTGVMVYDDDKVTGTIVERVPVETVEDAMRECFKPFQRVYGCTIALDVGEYRIVWVERLKVALEHEECHAYYEEGRHVNDY